MGRKAVWFEWTPPNLIGTRGGAIKSGSVQEGQRIALKWYQQHPEYDKSNMTTRNSRARNSR